MYSAEVLDHFQNPRNAGEVPAPDASAQIENPACGDILQLSLRTQDGRIVEARFRAKGCVPAMACGSALTELIQGKTIEEVRQLRKADLIRLVGGLPEASSHAGHLAMDTLAAVLKKISS
jgi:nitrogen fixation protein NifU and related proteins